MNSTIVLFLLQDGIINGAIYALLAVALVLVFAVTRVIFVPQGEYVAYAALTLAALQAGRVPGIVWLLVAVGAAAAVAELWRSRTDLHWRRLAAILGGDVALPLALAGIAYLAAPLDLGLIANAALTLALVVPLGPFIYRLAFQPLANASVLVLLIAAVGVHLALLGLGLAFFGPEGYRIPPLSRYALDLGGVPVSAQSMIVIALTLLLLFALYLFFGRTLLGKALRAAALNRRGALLVGISPGMAGRLAFGMAALIGALSGVLIAPLTTIYFDSGFLIGLKGFVAAIIGGLVSYPLTVAAALVVGLVEAFSSFWASSFKEVIVFTVILPILLWRSLRSTHYEDEE